MKTFQIGDEVREAVGQKGAAAFRVSDGTVFVFSTETLQRLLIAAQTSEEQMAVVFCQRSPDVESV